MLADSQKIVRNLKKKLGLKIIGEVYKGKPESVFEEDVSMHTK